MREPALQIGRRAVFSKTVGESDVYLFAGITGDLSPNHVNEQAMNATAYGRRIAHGALLVGFMSNTSTRILDTVETPNSTAVSLGYDRIRFLKPVFIGDTITVAYEIDHIDPESHRSEAAVQVHNQNGELVAVARHILAWVQNPQVPD